MMIRRFLMLSLVAGLWATAAGVASAQDKLDIDDLLGTGGQFGAPTEKADVWAELVADKAEEGGTAYLRVHADLPLDHYIYSTNKSFSGHTEIKVLDLKGLEPLDDEFHPEKKPKVVYEELFKQDIEKFFDNAVWVRRYRITGDPESVSISGELTGQYCSSGPGGACTPIRPAATFTESLKVDSELAEKEAALFASMPEPASPAGADQNPDTAPDGAESHPDHESASASAIGLESGGDSAGDADPRKKGLIGFLVVAIGSGFLALLTPCVFPMVPITVSFFLKQAEGEDSRPVLLASTYCLGIIGTFTILGLLMSIFFRAASLNALANNPLLNVFIGAVLVFFGLSLLGLFEIRMPSWLVNWSASKRSQGGLLGTIFMAVTFTLVSFTCTFAFVGGLLAWAARGEYYWATIGMVAFSAAFSLPFFFLALFPAFLKKLPKSGGWMNTVKVTLGIVEIGAALKFFSTADLASNPTPMIFDYSMVMTGWMVLAGLAGFYLLGSFRLPHDDAGESISVIRFGFAALFIGFAAYLSSGLFGRQEPEGVLWSQIAALAPPRFETGPEIGVAHGGGEPDDTPGPVIRHSGLGYALNFETAQKFAEEENRLLFLDFTGVNCPNCRLMERDVLPKGKIPGLLRKFVRVSLYTDQVPLIKDRALVQKLLEQNRLLQENWFDDVTLPAYAVVSPDGKTILSAAKGYNPDVERFRKFLELGIERWEGQQVASRASQSDAD